MSYVGAPYNFVPFPKAIRVYSDEKLPGHNQAASESEDPKQELLSGEVSYTITAKTPFFVGSGRKVDNIEKFYQNAEGKYTVPGSSVRGLIRSNVQLLSHSSFAEDIDDYALMYRNVTGNSAKDDRYNAILGACQTNNRISIVKNVRAGYIRNTGGNYYIYDTSLERIGSEFGEMNYYILSERKIIESYLSSLEENSVFPYPLFNKGGKNILQHKIDKPFIKIGEGKRTQYKGTVNEEYIPYSIECSYEVNDRNITAVDSPGVYKNNGYAVSTGYINMKKAVYIIPEIREDEHTNTDGLSYPLKLPEKDVRAFRIDISKRKTVLGSIIDHFDLPSEGKTKPVFYIIIGDKYYFGFTPRLRVFYDYTIKGGMTDDQKQDVLDYSKALFGCSGDSRSYKSRLSFSDALICGNQKPKTITGAYILAEPKPTSTLDYIVPEYDGEGNVIEGHHYNDAGFSICGVKQYWLKNQVDQSNVPSGKDNKEYVLKFDALNTDTSFEGRIRFHNLRREELGLLLMALHLGENVRLNMGKAKAFGYGMIDLAIRKVRVLDRKLLCDLDNLCLDPYREIGGNDIDDLIREYCDGMASYIGQTSVDYDESINVLKLMKNVKTVPEQKSTLPDPAKVRPMSIDKREYQSRTEPLQSPYKLLDLPYTTESARIGQLRISDAKKARGSLQKGEEYEAVVKKIDGKKVKFRTVLHGIDSQLTIENIKYAKLEKKTLKATLPEGTTIVVRLDDMVKDGDKTRYSWTCTARK